MTLTALAASALMRSVLISSPASPLARTTAGSDRTCALPTPAIRLTINATELLIDCDDSSGLT